MVTGVDHIVGGVSVAPHASADQRDVLAERNVDLFDDAAIGQLKVNDLALPATRGDRGQVPANRLGKPPRGPGAGQEQHSGQKDGHRHDESEGEHAVIMDQQTERSAAPIAEEGDARRERCRLDQLEVEASLVGQDAGSDSDERSIDKEAVLVDQVRGYQLLSHADTAHYAQPARPLSQRPHRVEAAQDRRGLPPGVLQRRREYVLPGRDVSVDAAVDDELAVLVGVSVPPLEAPHGAPSRRSVTPPPGGQRRGAGAWGSISVVRSRWFRSGVAEGGGLWLPGWPSNRGAGVWLRPDGLVLAARGATACLAWQDHDDRQRQPSRSTPNGWWVTSYTSGWSGDIGVAIGVNGEAAAATAAVRAATNTWLTRFHRLHEDGTAVALRWTLRISPWVDAERDTLSALCRVAAEQPPLRSRLADPHRVGMLIEAMANGAVRARREAHVVRRSRMEVLTAMRSLGHHHRIGGRPLPGEPLPAAEMVVDQILNHVARSPYAQGVSLERAAVAKLVKRHYLDIEPWPFAALTEAAPLRG